MTPATTFHTPTYDPVLSLLADAMELIAAAREEYASFRWDEEVDARVAAILRDAVPDEAAFANIRKHGLGPISSVEVTR